MADTVLKCPQCGKKVVEVTQFEVSYTDPHFNHKCGAKGVLRWRRGELVKVTKT